MASAVSNRRVREESVRLLCTAPRAATIGGAQSVALTTNASTHWLLLPRPTCEVEAGIRWGYVDECYSAAFWATLAWQHRLSGEGHRRHAIGRDLREEIAVCLLGGHGMPAEVGIAAFESLRGLGLLNRSRHDAEALEAALRVPLSLGQRQVQYRFPRVKARQLAQALTLFERSTPPTDSLSLREWLRTMPGIGPKTASWIVRNRDAAARVAILDIHIIRACQILALFPQSCRLPRDYEVLEKSFICFSDALGVLPGDLDAVMWHEMRLAPSLVERALSRRGAASCRDGP